MKVYVNFNDRRWKKYKINFSRIARIAAGEKYKNAEVSITLVDDKEIHNLNKQYRDIDRPTNVLSFELGDDTLLGDIYISLDTVIREAAAADISVEDHVAHLVVHGVLHLLGYDHITDKDATVMENMEIKLLKKMGIKNPYIDESVACSGFYRRVMRAKKIWNIVGCAICGAVASLGFAPFYMWWATLIGLGGAYWISTSRDNNRPRCIWCAALFGAFYGMCMFWWVLHSIYVVPELTSQFAIWTVPGMLGLGLAGAVVFSIPFIVAAKITNPAARPFVFAGTWTVILWAREWVFTGFPWNPIANISMKWGGLANSMSVWGALGLTFIIVGFVGASVELLRCKKRAMCMICWGVFVSLGCAGAVLGRYNINITNMMSDGVRPIVRIVQPARAQNQKIAYSRADALEMAEQNVRDLLALGQVDGNVPDLIVYPETTYPFVVLPDDDMPFSKILNTNVILGASVYDNGKMHNSMVLADKDGKIINIYNKSHLVPFGEYRPLGILPAPVNLARGDGAVVLNAQTAAGVFAFVPAICYEIIFSDSLMQRDIPTPGAIINITNDTWFGKTPGTYQHLDMVRRYAIESGLPVVRANYSGISAFISSDGKVISALPVGVRGTLDGMLGSAHETIYRKIGRDGWMIIILLVACVGAIAVSVRSKD